MGTKTLRALLLLAAVSVAPWPAAPGASAASGTGWSEDDTITAQVQDGTPRSVVGANCDWHVVTGTDPRSGSVTEGPVQRTVNGERETLYQRHCTVPGQASWYQWIKETTKRRVIQHAQARASEKIAQLVFSTAPPRDRVVVNVGTWFWVPKTIWRKVSATAYIETPVGVVKVTVTATPSRLRFDPGNGDDPVWCTGPGEPWRQSYGDDSVSDCMYTYRHSSDGVGRFRGHTGVQWDLKVSSNFGISFPLPDVTLSMPAQVTVRELQAVLAG